MKNIFLLLICTFSFYTFTFAQFNHEKSVAEIEMERNTFGNPYNAAHQNYYLSKKSRIVGGEEIFYLNKNWSKSKVIDKDGNETILDQANYLVKKRLILFKKKNKELFQIYPHAVKMVIIEGKIFKPYPSVNKDKRGIQEFYEVPITGHLELVKVWDLKESSVSNNPMGIAVGDKIAITKTSRIYYKKGKQRKLKRMPKKKDDRYAIFGGKRRTVMAYAKEHNLSIKKEADLFALYTYYNAQVSLEEKENN